MIVGLCHVLSVISVITVFVITRNPGKQGKWFESYGEGGGALKKLRVGLGRKASFDVNFWGFSFLQNQGYRKQGLNTH